MRIAVVASTYTLRAGLRALIEAADEGQTVDRIEVVYEAASLDDFEAEWPVVDVLVVAGGGPSGGDFRRGASEVGERPALLLLTDDPAAARRLRQLELPAWGVLSPDCSEGELLAALRALNEGLVVATPGLLALPMPSRLVSGVATDDQPDPLTERESQVLQLVARGLANKQIAAALNISEHTVKFHVSSIFTKLEVSSRTEAVRSGVQRGLIVL
jgi:DNA-binding NarL/FixJ family response regulator